jgi:hypothetical protein
VVALHVPRVYEVSDARTFRRFVLVGVSIGESVVDEIPLPILIMRTFFRCFVRHPRIPHKKVLEIVSAVLLRFLRVAKMMQDLRRK